MSAVGDARKRQAETQPAYKPEGYTECDQRSDRSFLVGVNYGRESERARIADLLAEARAEERERVAQVAEIADELLTKFTEHGHPGRPCLRTPWITTDQVIAWRARLTEIARATSDAEAVRDA